MPRVAFALVKDATLKTSMGARVFQGVLCANSVVYFYGRLSPRLLLHQIWIGLVWGFTTCMPHEMSDRSI
jgi:hypothetical protein